jgi:gamma-glutamyl phosphate reductase
MVGDASAAAIDHVTHFTGPGHSEAIVTRDIGAAGQFTTTEDWTLARHVVVNASTRFVLLAASSASARDVCPISTQKLRTP